MNKKRDIVDVFRSQSQVKSSADSSSEMIAGTYQKSAFSGVPDWSGRRSSATVKIRQQISDDILKKDNGKDDYASHFFSSEHVPYGNVVDTSDSRNPTTEKKGNKKGPSYSQLRNEVECLRLKLKEKTSLDAFGDDTTTNVRTRARSDARKILEGDV